jgi:uncharacterized protein YbjT (DUF2867 family)
MNYVITGSLGNISRPIVLKLIAAGHNVKVITSRQAGVKAINELGATAAAGSVEDVDFLAEAFAGADAVYTMVPPKWDAADWKAYIGQIGSNYAEAIKATGIKYIVNLSSHGAHLENGAGPVSGLYRAEQALNALDDVNILHLRPGFFFSNFFSNIGMIKQAGIIGSNNRADNTMILSDTTDVAEAAAEALLALNFKGHTVAYVANDERTPAEIAAVLGKEIGNPALPWVEFTDEQSIAGLEQAGMSHEVAVNYTEMGAALRSGQMMEDYKKHRPSVLGKIKLEDFANAFAMAFDA